MTKFFIIMICFIFLLFSIYYLNDIETSTSYKYEYVNEHVHESELRHEVKVGQIWVWPDTLDPFKPASYDTLKVLEIKGNYSKVFMFTGDTISMRTIIINCCDNYLLK